MCQINVRERAANQSHLRETGLMLKLYYTDSTVYFNVCWVANDFGMSVLSSSWVAVGLETVVLHEPSTAEPLCQRHKTGSFYPSPTLTCHSPGVSRRELGSNLFCLLYDKTDFSRNKNTLKEILLAHAVSRLFLRATLIKNFFKNCLIFPHSTQPQIRSIPPTWSFIPHYFRYPFFPVM